MQKSAKTIFFIQKNINRKSMCMWRWMEKNGLGEEERMVIDDSEQKKVKVRRRKRRGAQSEKVW